MVHGSTLQCMVVHSSARYSAVQVSAQQGGVKYYTAMEGTRSCKVQGIARQGSARYKVVQGSTQHCLVGSASWYKVVQDHTQQCKVQGSAR